jgi:ArsR family transcriptional regulator, cadmium/lead-responsive transcriptional repressor
VTKTQANVALAAKLFRGFGDQMRLAILAELAQAGELRVTDLVASLGGSQSNMSGHMACLKDCGLVVDRPEGRQVFYRIAADEVVGVLRSAEDLLGLSGEQIELCPNYPAP